MSESFRRKLLLLALATTASASARATALDPLAYNSLGTFNDTTTNGTVTANGTAAPTLVVGSTTYTGVYQAQGSGLPAVAVFDFNNVTLGAGFTLAGSTSVPVAILSQGGMTISGTINANGFGGGAGGTAGTGSGSGSSGGMGGGTGGGGGSTHSSYAGAGGGGYGGRGSNGAGYSAVGVAGPTYGNLAASLQAGSGGGGSGSGYYSGAAGGAGGGGLELGATGSLSLASSGAINAVGTAGTSNSGGYGSGGGSGGGLFLHGGSLSLGGSIAANGGNNGEASFASGGAGGGGRVLLAVPTFTVGTSLAPTATVNVAGGHPAQGYGTSGSAGVAGLTVDVTTVPSGQTLAITNGNLTGTSLSFSSNAIEVQDGGTFTNTGGYTNAAGAEVYLGGFNARVTGGTITNNGLIDGSAGRIEAIVANQAGGEIRAVAGSDLVFTATGSTNAGAVNLFGGTAEFRGGLTNTGMITGHGTLTLGGTGLVNSGTVTFSQSSDVTGSVANRSGGTLTATGGATATYFNSVSLASGSTVRTDPASTTVFVGAVTGSASFTGSGTVDFDGSFTPGSGGSQAQGLSVMRLNLAAGSPMGTAPATTTNFAGDLTLGSTNVLTLNVGGTVAGTDYDQILVSGKFTLGGTLVVDLTNGFSPAPGEAFKLLGWGTEAGAFSTLDLPALSAGLSWDTNDLYVDGTLSVVPEPSTWALLGVAGAAALLGVRQRRHGLGGPM